MMNDTSLAQLHLSRADDLLSRVRELLDSGDLVLAREMVQDYMFALFDAKTSLRQDPNPRLDATISEWTRTGQRYLDNLDAEIGAMTDDDDQPATQAGLTENLPTVGAPEVVQAWSDDDDELSIAIESRHSWRSAWGIVAVILACCVVLGGAVSAALWVNGFRDDGSNIITPHAVPAPVTTTAVAASVTPTPATTTRTRPTPVFTTYDDRALLGSLQALSYTGRNLVLSNPTRVVMGARMYCLAVAAGKTVDQADRESATATGFDAADTYTLTVQAQQTYQGCNG